MIYRFQCKAAGDVLMTGPVGERLLGIVGKPVAPQGILQPGDLASAIDALQRAVAEDETRLSALQSKSAVVDSIDADAQAEAVSLRQHAWPLIEMMKQAQSANEAIVWGV